MHSCQKSSLIKIPAIFSFPEIVSVQGRSDSLRATCKILNILGNSRGSFLLHLNFQGSHRKQVQPSIQNLSSDFLKIPYWCDINIREEKPPHSLISHIMWCFGLQNRIDYFNQTPYRDQRLKASFYLPSLHLAQMPNASC